MSEKEKARRDFWDEYELDKRPPREASAMCLGWMIGFERGRRTVGGEDAKVLVIDPYNGVRLVSKSGGTLTGNLAAKEEQRHSFLAGESEKIRKTGGLAELAFGMAAIALTISGVTLITIIVQSLSKGV